MKEKYQAEWANGQKSAFAVTKEQAINGINHWIKNETNWKYIVVKNIITDSMELIEETHLRIPISDLTV